MPHGVAGFWRQKSLITRPGRQKTVTTRATLKFLRDLHADATRATAETIRTIEPSDRRDQIVAMYSRRIENLDAAILAIVAIGDLSL